MQLTCLSLPSLFLQVNTKTAARLLAQDAAAAATAAVDGAAAAAAGEPAPAARRGPEPGAGASMLGDTRFGAMFEDADFTINEGSDEFKLLHPNAVKEKAAERRLLTEHFKEVLSDEDEDEPSDEEMEEDDGSEEEDGSEDSLEEMGEAPPKRVPARLNPKLRNGRGRGETGGRAALSVKDGGVKKPAHQVSMFAARDAGAADAYRRQESLAGLLSMPLSERVAGDSGKAFKHIGGSRELKFVARADREDGGGSGGRGGRGGRGRGGENGMSQRSDRGESEAGDSERRRERAPGGGDRGRGRGGRGSTSSRGGGRGGGRDGGGRGGRGERSGGRGEKSNSGGRGSSRGGRGGASSRGGSRGGSSGGGRGGRGPGGPRFLNKALPH